MVLKIIMVGVKITTAEVKIIMEVGVKIIMVEEVKIIMVEEVKIIMGEEVKIMEIIIQMLVVVMEIGAIVEIFELLFI